MTQLTKNLTKRTAVYMLGSVILIGALTLAITSITSANASSVSKFSTTKTRAIHSTSTVSSKSQPARATTTLADNATKSTVSPTAASSTSDKIVDEDSSANNDSVSPASPVSSNTSAAQNATPAPAPAAQASTEGDVYDGYGYQVQPTQITETISKASAQVCAGYLCGTEGVSIKNVSSPSSGGFQFNESREDNVEFYIASGGLSIGNGPVFSPISINPNLPNGTYTGTVQLQLSTDSSTSTYADGPTIEYTVDLTD